MRHLAPKGDWPPLCQSFQQGTWARKLDIQHWDDSLYVVSCESKSVYASPLSHHNCQGTCIAKLQGEIDGVVREGRNIHVVHNPSVALNAGSILPHPSTVPQSSGDRVVGSPLVEPVPSSVKNMVRSCWKPGVLLCRERLLVRGFDSGSGIEGLLHEFHCTTYHTMALKRSVALKYPAITD